MKILIATTNLGKFKEFQELLTKPGLELFSLRDLNIQLDVKEDGKTYRENAAVKASAYAKVSDMITLSDDSGLEVDALDGAPGIYSARYSPILNASDADRRAALLAALKDKPRPWTARFHAAIAIAFSDGSSQFTEGVCEGEIIPEERGTNGFGYDPIFFIPEFNRTMAELTMEEKNTISHRAIAAKKALALL